MNTRELNFAYKVRHALNENLETIPAPAAERLVAARRIALSRRKTAVAAPVLLVRQVFAGARGRSGGSHPWLAAAAAMLPAIVLVAGLASIIQYEEQRRIADTAEIDAEMLADELPLSAYLDNGFNAFLSKRGD
ncbi:MAG TPA: DUF3619 family protein [Noviherbaspirillum sp.]|jgi:hypothetical protein|uniref:DUF3619 family protein n=1 Tax=Noviherbaspirillum sp. TaxID=1926288 RepID=UPI002F91FB23